MILYVDCFTRFLKAFHFNETGMEIVDDAFIGTV